MFELQRDDAPAAAYGLVLAEGAVVLTWAGRYRTIAHYADRGAVETLHGQRPPPGVTAPRHRIVDLAGDAAGARAAREHLAELVPAMHTAATQARRQLDGDNPLRLVALERMRDPTGISGTGHVAYGLVLTDGAVVLTWRGSLVTIARYPSLQAVRDLHGHGGATTLQPLTDPTGHRDAVRLLAARLPRMRDTAAHAAGHLTAPCEKGARR